GRHSGRTADQIRSHHQSDDGQGARPRNPAGSARPRRRGDRVKRREFITLLGGAAAAWPLAARAQQSMPVVGVLYSGSLEMFETLISAFRKGLNEQGYVEGRNLALEMRLAEGHYHRLPSLGPFPRLWAQLCRWGGGNKWIAT